MSFSPVLSDFPEGQSSSCQAGQPTSAHDVDDRSACALHPVRRHKQQRSMRVLYLTHRLPYAPNRGDRVRSYQTLRALRRCVKVDVVSLVHDAAELAQVGRVRELADHVDLAPVTRIRNFAAGVFRLPTATPLTHVLLHSPAMPALLRRIVAERRPDVVLAYCTGMARFAFGPELTGLPVVLDMVDVDSVKWKSLADRSTAPMRWIYRREATRLAAFEAEAVQRAVATIVVNDRERTALQSIVPNAPVEVMPNGVDSQFFKPAPTEHATSDVVFCGVMNYPPNEAGALWLARDIWPRVRQQCKEARLWLVGSQPTMRVSGLARDSSIKVTGAVPDVRPFLWRSAIAVAPLKTARGVQTKVLESVASGLPTIVTSAVAEGLPPEILAACRVANTTEAFADGIVEYLRLDARERRALAEHVNFQRFSWDRCLAKLATLLESAAQRGAEPAIR
jgi:sugar transferase (PEP-CTERM/EpsH1 system associated)